MGGFFNVWDLINQPEESTDPLAEERRRQLLMAGAEAPVAEDVDELAPLFEEPPSQDTIVAPNMVGTADPASEAMVQQYQDWLSRRPVRTEATGKDSTMAGLAGFLAGLVRPDVGSAVTRGMMEGPYGREMADWTAEGKALGEVGGLVTDIAENRRQREGDVLGWEGTKARVEAQLKAVNQRREAENQRHSDRMAALTEDSQKRQETTRHNKELEKLAKEANRIREIEAKARASTAKSYGSRVESLNKGEGDALPAHYRQAVLDTIGEMLVEYPQFEDYFKRDPATKAIVAVRPMDELPPPDVARFRAFIADAQVRAKKRLQIKDNGVDEYNPLRSDFP